MQEVMDKLTRHKGKNKKQPPTKTKAAKKRKSDGPTCSMFLAEITRKLAAGKRQEIESPLNIIQSIVDSITNALPIRILKREPPRSPSPVKIETLVSLSPELLPNDTLHIPHERSLIINDDLLQESASVEIPATEKLAFKIPKMPLINSDIFKEAAEKRKKTVMTDATTATTTEHDVASEIAKHVGTLRKISLIAEEFNQKTAKNLKEIVDSVQEDLMKKLEEVRMEQKAKALARAQALKLKEDAMEESCQE